jgi:hypothetical protein
MPTEPTIGFFLGLRIWDQHSIEGVGTGSLFRLVKGLFTVEHLYEISFTIGEVEWDCRRQRKQTKGQNHEVLNKPVTLIRQPFRMSTENPTLQCEIHWHRIKLCQGPGLNSAASPPKGPRSYWKPLCSKIQNTPIIEHWSKIQWQRSQ